MCVRRGAQEAHFFGIAHFKHAHPKHPKTPLWALVVQKYSAPQQKHIIFDIVHFKHAQTRYPKTLLLASLVQLYAHLARRTESRHFLALCILNTSTLGIKDAFGCTFGAEACEFDVPHQQNTMAGSFKHTRNRHPKTLLMAIVMQNHVRSACGTSRRLGSHLASVPAPTLPPRFRGLFAGSPAPNRSAHLDTHIYAPKCAAAPEPCLHIAGHFPELGATIRSILQPKSTFPCQAYGDVCESAPRPQWVPPAAQLAPFWALGTSLAEPKVKGPPITTHGPKHNSKGTSTPGLTASTAPSKPCVGMCVCVCACARACVCV